MITLDEASLASQSVNTTSVRMVLSEQSKNELGLEETLVDEICQKLFNTRTATALSCVTEKNSCLGKETRNEQAMRARRQQGSLAATKATIGGQPSQREQQEPDRRGLSSSAKKGIRNRDLQTLLI